MNRTNQTFPSLFFRHRGLVPLLPQELLVAVVTGLLMFFSLGLLFGAAAFLGVSILCSVVRKSDADRPDYACVLIKRFLRKRVVYNANIADSEHETFVWRDRTGC